MENTFGPWPIGLVVAANITPEQGDQARAVITFTPGEGFLVGAGSLPVTIDVRGSIEAKALADALAWASEAINRSYQAKGYELD